KLKVYRENMEKAQKHLTIQTDKLKQAQAEVSDYEWLIRDPLSNTGLKAYIFHSMIEKVNRHLKEYESVIGFLLKISIDLEKSRKDFNIQVFKNGSEVPSYD